MVNQSDQILKELNRICINHVCTHVCSANLSRWKVGEVADCILSLGNKKEVSELIYYLASNEIPYLVIGSTSNLLFSDAGVRAVILQIGERMSDFQISGNRVWTQAGKWVPGLARNVAQAGLSGIEHTAGIPGTIGGLICMNGGSQRKGIGSHIKSVTAVSPTGEIETFKREECKFEYRSSVFQDNGFIIVEAELEFNQGKKYSVIRDEMLEILRARRAKFPQRLPNCGSTFISNPEIYKKYGPPGAVIEELGFKGYRIGGAEVSSIHANFINNVSNAKANDVLAIIKELQEKVQKLTGFDMEAEVKYVNEQGEIKQAHLIL